MLYDLQVHSHYSKCAHPNMTIPNILQRAGEMGLTGIGITDHIHPHTNHDIIVFSRKELEGFGKPRLRVWVGAEVDVLNNLGETTGDPAFFKAVDYVLAGTHHFHLPWVEKPDYTCSKNDVLYFAHCQLIGAVKNPHIHALAHPWIGFQKYVKDFSFSFSELRKEWIFELGETAREKNVALEIPVRGLIKGDGEMNKDYLENFVLPLVGTGCPIMMGTDAHTIDAIGDGIESLFGILIKAGASIHQTWHP